MQQTLAATGASFLLMIATANCAPPQGALSKRPADYSSSNVHPVVNRGTTATEARARQATASVAAARLDFGSIPLGELIRSLPQETNLRRGCETRSNECGFDLNGVVYETDWENNMVVLKSIIVGDERPAWLPFDLRGDETIDAALTHLNKRFDGAFEIASNATGERLLIAHSNNERVDYFEVSLRFQREGRLSEVRASCCYD